MRIGSLNANGLKRRLCYPEFIDLINTYDIFCVLETNMDKYDIVDVKGYTFNGKFRNLLAMKKSGGIGIYIKEGLARSVEIIESTCDYILWLKVKHAILNIDSDLLLGCIYLPPTGSRYLDADQMLLLDDEITQKCAEYKYTLLLGDINARTACLSDHIASDDFLLSHFDFDTETSNYFHKHVVLENLGYKLKRISKDKKTNAHGYFLIEICRNSNLFMLNGRVGSDREVGEFTFRNKSVIDYALASVDLFRHLSNFSINQTDTLFSDGHALLSVDLASKYKIENVTNATGKKQTRKWNNKLSEKFANNINTTKLNNLLLLPDSKDIINQITSEISSVFETAVQKTFPVYHGKISENDKPWFGTECKRSRKAYHQAKTQYHRNKTSHNKSKLRRTSKQYKHTMHKHIYKHKYRNEQKLRNMHKQHPKQYWKFINSLKSKSKTVKPSIDDLYTFFRDSNTNTDTDTQFNLTDDILRNSQEELNCPFTENEIQKHITNLKNAKAPSPSDNILNEYIKSTRNSMVPIYTKLFNKVLNSGIMPDCWLEGYIIPIYKKGDPMEPNNYRPITLLSCLGKLFTSILNTRVTHFLEENDILNENQAGFRKDYSTTDHIFLLHSIFEILKKQKSCTVHS
ncbi:MAG: reverse transcriptase family protein [Sedimenticola sp.]